MNKISKQQFEQIKNESVAVISFSATTQQRVSGYANISYISAIEYTQIQQRGGNICMIVNMEQWNKVIEFEIKNKVNRIHMSDVLGMIRN